ncbi:hypothetical protein [Dyadobacter sp. NIV53]|uniref:hypothetical protein n=1 Tax=Dyadobacter sp. NIV53 TaxID=2861765 RepID=UPI001C869D1E|nr:hypothetical protein [Dyadobacter sp. NIV53]
MSKYVGTEGEFILKNMAEEMIEKHCQFAEKDQTRQFVKAEFFGLDIFKNLLDECEGKAVGFRIYYGLSDENSSEEGDNIKSKQDQNIKPTPRLIIVPVDTHGTELTSITNISTNRSVAAKKFALGKGPLCPNEC